MWDGAVVFATYDAATGLQQGGKGGRAPKIIQARAKTVVVETKSGKQLIIRLGANCEPR